jgi:hypothetical protein
LLELLARLDRYYSFHALWRCPESASQKLATERTRHRTLALIDTQVQLFIQTLQQSHHPLPRPAAANIYIRIVGLALPTFDHKSFAVCCPLALIGIALYPVLVHRLAVSIHASSPHSVALMQLRFTSFAVVSLRQDFHPQDCAHAGRITKSPARKNLGGAYLSSALSTDDGQ